MKDHLAQARLKRQWNSRLGHTMFFQVKEQPTPVWAPYRCCPWIELTARLRAKKNKRSVVMTIVQPLRLTTWVALGAVEFDTPIASSTGAGAVVGNTFPSSG